LGFVLEKVAFMKCEFLRNKKQIFGFGVVPDFFYLSGPLLVLIFGTDLDKGLEVFNGVVVMILLLE
jgi:hypothetical protein